MFKSAYYCNILKLSLNKNVFLIDCSRHGMQNFHSLLNIVSQWPALENQKNPFYVVNKVTLRGQNPFLKFCYALEIYSQLKTSLDLLLLKIWGLQVKGLQSYWPSNFALVHSLAFTAEESASAIGPDSRTPGVKAFSKFDGK